MSLVRSFLTAILLTVLICGEAAAQASFTRDFAISECCRLTEEQRYADAVLMAERLRLSAPDDIYSEETVGAVALQVGAISIASKEFDAVLVQSPLDPLGLYGKSLVELLKGKYDTALLAVNAIDQSNLSPASQTDISLVKAICLTETDNTNAALSLLAGDSEPAAQELTALINYRLNRSDPSPLKNILDQALINGIPSVVEPVGLRLLAPDSRTGPAIEPSITDADISHDLTNRFDSSYITGGLRAINGDISLALPRQAASGTYLMTLTVDGEVVGITNRQPYRFNWDTRTVKNGVHSCVFKSTNTYGIQAGIQEEDLYVLNTDQPGAGDSAPLPSDQIDRIWSMLRVQPGNKVADYELALSLLNSHDAEGYETYILRAAALDPDYRDVRSRIRPLFASQVPNKFPIPDGTTLPSSLGLSAGTASAAGFWAGSAHIREIALTFDDGPDPIPSHQLVEALKEANVHATFFVVGMRAVESPDSLREMAANGNSVEDHTFTHPNLTQILPQHIMLEILRTAVVIQATTGLWPHFLRPPGGNTNSLVLATAKVCGMSGAFWTIDALPAEESGSPSAVAKWVLSRARPGAIVLMHNGMAATVGAIPELVQGLRSKGYRLVTIRQLAADAL